MNTRKTELLVFIAVILPLIVAELSPAVAKPKVVYNIAQVEARAVEDVDIRRGTSETDELIVDPIWRSLGFDPSNGEPLPTDRDDPIADAILQSSGPERAFIYGYKLACGPSAAGCPSEVSVRYRWRIKGTRVRSGGYVRQTGMENSFSVSLPDQVGRYTLSIKLQVYEGRARIGVLERQHILYVLWNEPVDSPIGSIYKALNPPWTAWLDVALGWADGESSEEGILAALNAAVYRNPFGWDYGVLGGIVGDPIQLIEGRAEEADGGCAGFRDVWRLLAAVLGIKTSAFQYEPGSKFMTLTHPALDKNYSANAVNIATGKRDRWVFTNHELGLNFTEDKFYDPTYGLIGEYDVDLDSNVFCFVNSDGTCTLQDPPPTKVRVWPTGAGIHGRSEYGFAAGPREKLAVRDLLLEELELSTDPNSTKSIKNSIRFIERSLALEFWEDEWRLTAMGMRVFDEEKRAVRELMKIKDSALWPMIDEILEIDEQLASTAIDDAVSEGGDPAGIFKAQDELSRAVTMRDRGKFVRAVEHCGKAWKHAWGAWHSADDD